MIVAIHCRGFIAFSEFPRYLVRQFIPFFVNTAVICVIAPLLPGGNLYSNFIIAPRILYFFSFMEDLPTAKVCFSTIVFMFFGMV